MVLNFFYCLGGGSWKLHFFRACIHSLLSLSFAPGAKHGTYVLNPCGNIFVFCAGNVVVYPDFVVSP